MSRAAWATRVAVVALVAAGAHGCAGTAPAPVAASPAPPQFAQLNRPGELVDVEAAIVPGRVTIIDFRADWCGGCEVVDQRLRAGLADDRRVVVRTVDVGDGATPVATAYGIRGLPHVLIVDRAGALRYRLVGNDALAVVELARALADEP
ncbi:MAG: thioredoxin family protein [Kofleriaceae bacterium]